MSSTNNVSVAPGDQLKPRERDSFKEGAKERELVGLRSGVQTSQNLLSQTKCLTTNTHAH